MGRSFSCFPAARVFVTYGPTEAAVDTTTFEANDSSAAHAVVSIGCPDAFRAVDLGFCTATADVDVPVAVVLGSVGELQISGPGLAKGYLKMEGQAFESAPRAAGKRYSTGDAVRWAKEGLEFLGRLDSQAGLSR